VQWYDGAGKRREAAFRTNREARDFKIKLEHDQREGTFVDPRLGREPCSDAARRWLGGLAVAPETRRAYQSVLNNYVLPTLGDRAPRQVAQDREGTAQRLNQSLAELSRQRRGGNRADSTPSRHLYLLGRGRRQGEVSWRSGSGSWRLPGARRVATAR